ncbi:MAG: 2-oxoacid:acceptor oxidoreductase family protein [Patescibacteria group bacterium]
MFEARFHGRAGQGAKLAAQLLAESAMLEGMRIQAFPEYGPERSGAPVASYVRLDKDEIRAHYPITSPDAILVLDPTLLDAIDVDAGAKKDTIVIINSSKSTQELKLKYKLVGKIYAFDASKIALETIGVNKPNTILLAFLLQLSKVVKIDSLNQMVREIFADKNKPELVESNLAAVEKGYNYKAN